MLVQIITPVHPEIIGDYLRGKQILFTVEMQPTESFILTCPSVSAVLRIVGDFDCKVVETQTFTGSQFQIYID